MANLFWHLRRIHYIYAAMTLQSPELIKNIESYLRSYPTVAFYKSNGHEGFEDLLLASSKPPVDKPESGRHYLAFISYDHKNQLEAFVPKHVNPLQFPSQLLVEAEAVVSLSDLTFPDTAIINQVANLRAVVSRDQYLEQVRHLKRHISLGDIYEINYCIPFEAHNASIDPLALYQALNRISKASYSSFLKFNDLYIISSSPELFLSKRENQLRTKPIKGTARRGQSVEEDATIRDALFCDRKERNENVMIVDVARNDLSRLAQRGSVKVDKLFDIESYSQVHQMVSTISCTIRPGTSFNETLAATFPMASMTGAPKYRAMQLIDQYETYNRGPYSGSLGYLKPNGDFDLNVLIRSVFYDAASGYLSFTVGSAITDLCNPEEEYAECLLKAKAMIEVLGVKQD